jgi:hypothetical protein
MVERPYAHWAKVVINSHKSLGYQVLFSKEELEQRAKNCGSCELCGDALDWNRVLIKGFNNPYSPSLDRVNNELILTVENTAIVHFWCNTMKSNQTRAALIDRCTKIVAHANEEK